MNDIKKYKTFGKNRSLRLKDFDYSQSYFVYFLTICTYSKNNYFENNSSLAESVIDNLKNYIAKFNYNLMVYCLMPNHLHFLVQANDGAGDLKDLIRDFKKFSTKSFWELGNSNKLWQRGYFEHILRKFEYINKIAFYMLNNPVRKQLVEKWEDYPYCGFC